VKTDRHMSPQVRGGVSLEKVKGTGQDLRVKKEQTTNFHGGRRKRQEHRYQGVGRGEGKSGIKYHGETEGEKSSKWAGGVALGRGEGIKMTRGE